MVQTIKQKNGYFTYSDRKMKIMNAAGVVYLTAFDVSKVDYTETDEPISDEEFPADFWAKNLEIEKSKAVE